jgi:glyoxylase-like metal-dependent hydrolase (beta-lactamase superfamily II)
MSRHASCGLARRSAAAAACVVAMLVVAAGPSRLTAQQPATPAGRLETIQVRPNVYVIFGAGANITVQTGPEGAIVVDTGEAAMAEQVLAAIKAVTPKQIRYIFNTSADADHVGGNDKLAASGVSFNNNAQFVGGPSAEVVAREEVLLRMSAPSGEQSPFATALWPTETFTQNTRSMYANGEGIQAIHQPAAHTDGDSIIFLRRNDVIATGDIIDLRRFPMIDRARGGSIQGEIEALNRLLVLAIPAMPLVWQEDRTVLVPGHGRLADHAELVEYRDMVTIVRDLVQHMIDKGMALDQIKKANPTDGFRGRYGADAGPWTTDMFVEAVYRDLAARPKKQS